MASEKEKNRSIKTFGFASFLNDMGAYMINPIWPLFITVVLGANMTILGLIDGLGDALVSISQAVSGYYSDKLKKRKVFIWLGYFFGAISRIGYALSKNWQTIVPFRVLDRAGKIRDAPRDAIIADYSTRKNRGRNFGFLETMDKLGAVLGSLIALIVVIYLSYNFNYRNLFLLAAIPSIIGVFLILSVVKEKKQEKIKIYKGISLKNISPNLRLFIILSAIFALGSFSYSFLIIYAKQFGFKEVYIPALYLLFVAFSSLIALPIGKLSDKIGRKPIVALSFILWILVCFSFLLTKNIIIITLAFILYGMHYGAINTVQKTLVSELAEKKFRASTLGAFQMIIGIVALPASLIAGILWDKIGLTIPLYVSIGLTLISLIILSFVKESRN